MKRCNQCRRESYDDANFCYYCGKEFILDEKWDYEITLEDFVGIRDQGWQVPAISILSATVLVAFYSSANSKDAENWLKITILALNCGINLILTYAAINHRFYFKTLSSKLRNLRESLSDNHPVFKWPKKEFCAISLPSSVALFSLIPAMVSAVNIILLINEITDCHVKYVVGMGASLVAIVLFIIFLHLEGLASNKNH